MKHCASAHNITQRPLQPRAHPGVCDAAMPAPDLPGDCTDGLMGSWSPFLVDGCSASRLAQCIARCERCTRCRYVSVHKTEDKCAWFHLCPLAPPSQMASIAPGADEWQTAQVRAEPSTRRALPRRGCRQYIRSWASLSVREQLASSHCPRHPASAVTLVPTVHKLVLEGPMPVE